MQSPRRYPRTMEEAFGPYARGSLSEPYTPMHTADKIVLTASIIVGIGLLVALVIGAL
jgi:hypothetical protein